MPEVFYRAGCSGAEAANCGVRRRVVAGRAPAVAIIDFVIAQPNGWSAPQTALRTANSDSLAPDEIGHAIIRRKPVEHTHAATRSKGAKRRRGRGTTVA
ncbi:hypothetical protein [Caballeronia sp. BCC1704]|uniref:hypothetical protein n=1 Tax=Caballeronia sp. BCC1704 TaxID=2676300 RepID=UPI00158A902C|nr:hypothetical protein [Caballeronia sp. BCC1704]